MHCLFEQSGTFKNEFIKLGYEAYDYDIQDEFGETDYIVDLFQNIKDAYAGKPSIFDNFNENDLVLAFFPCTRFETKIQLFFRGEAYQQRNWSDTQKLKKSMELHNELHEFYELVSMLALISIERGFKMVLENPRSSPHYLTDYWCIKPKIIDKDRTENGDYYKKPTQYWFFNFEPMQNLVFEPITYVQTTTIDKGIKLENAGKKTARSMIHPQYANRFIRQYLIPEGE